MTSNPASALFLRRLAAPLLIAMTAALAPAQAATPIDRILVVVNDGVILQSELNAAMREAGRQIQTRGIAAPDTDVLRAQVLERLILTRIQTHSTTPAGNRFETPEPRRARPLSSSCR